MKNEMNNFLKYPSLRLPVVDSFRRLPEDIALTEWYATEKLNGTNVSIVLSEDGDFEYFNRTVVLENQHRVDTLKKVVEKGLGDIMKQLLTLQGYKRVHVFGELFGAGIHKMTYALNELGVKEFRVFSVFLYKGNGLYDVLSLNQLQTGFSDYLVPIEGVGTLFEMLTLDKDKESAFGGEREGYVLYPTEHVEYNTNLQHPFFNGIKVKYGKFAEKTTQRVKSKPEFSDEENELLEELTQYVTVARVFNVASHSELPLERKNIGTYLGLVREDILKEYLGAIPENANLTKVLGTLNKTISKSIINAFEEQ